MSAPTVVVTRAEGPEGPLSTQLRRLGLGVLRWPTVSHLPTERPELAEALAHVQDFDWIVFASRHAVTAVLDQVPEPPAGVLICALGASTAQALRDEGWPVDMVPEDPSAEGVVAAFASRHGPPGRVLYPASSLALSTIVAGLTRQGVQIFQVEAYRTLPAELDVASCHTLIEQRGVAAVTFASPSAVNGLACSLGREDFDRLLDVAIPVAIGTTSARALADLGYTAKVPERATLEALALTTYLSLQTRH
jgi:uroporphyrinogen-III synthase